jgi:uncharacterized membrane protein YfcA
MLVLAAVLVALGAAQMTRSRRRNRAQRQRNSTGMLLIIIGLVIGLIVWLSTVGA